MPTQTAKRQAVAAVFGDVPADSQYVDFLYARRHLATVPEGGFRELKYIVEFDELEQTVWKALRRIRTRDGAEIAREVADRLVESIRLG